MEEEEGSPWSRFIRICLNKQEKDAERRHKLSSLSSGVKGKLEEFNSKFRDALNRVRNKKG